MSAPLPYEYFNLSEEERNLVETWEQLLPPLISRRHADWFLGGVISQKVLANADSYGTGPKDPIRIGRCVSYWTRHLLIWLVQSKGINQVQSLLVCIVRPVG